MDLSFLNPMMQQNPNMPIAQVPVAPVPLAAPNFAPIPMQSMVPQQQMEPAAAPAPAVPLASAQPMTMFDNSKDGKKQTGFFNEIMGKIDTDPNFKNALLVAGLSMLQGQRPGESTAGQLSRGALAGFDFKQKKDAADEQLKIEQEKARVQNASTEANTAGTLINNTTLGDKNQAMIDETKAQTDNAVARTVAQTTQNDILNATKDDAIQLSALKLANAKTDTQRDAIKAAAEKRANDIALLYPEAERAAIMGEWEAKKLLPAKVKADINQSNASAGASSANAAQTRAETGIINTKQATINSMTPEERKALVTNPSGTSSSTISNINSAMANWDTLNPEPKDQTSKDNRLQKRAQFELNLRTSTKENSNARANTLQNFIMNNPDDPSVPELKQELQGLLTQNGNSAKATSMADGIPGSSAGQKKVLTYNRQTGMME